MLDIKFIRENKDLIQTTTKDKNINLNIEDLLLLDSDITKLKTTIQNLREKKNTLTESISKLPENEKTKVKEESKEIGITIKNYEKDLSDKLLKFNDIMLQIPNIIDPETPIGIDDSFNKVIRKE